MPRSLYLYTFEDKNENPVGDEVSDPQEAREYGEKHQLRVIEHKYNWVGSYCPDGLDFTPTDEEK